MSLEDDFRQRIEQAAELSDLVLASITTGSFTTNTNDPRWPAFILDRLKVLESLIVEIGKEIDRLRAEGPGE